MLETFEEAATDARKFRRLAALARVHEAFNSPPEFAMRDMASSRLLGEYLSQAVVGRARMPPPEDGQTLMTDYPAG